MYQVKIYNKISEIDRKCWDELTEDNLYMCYDWLSTFEEILHKPPLPYYITIVKDEKIVAVSVCYLEKRNEYSRSVDETLLGRLINFRLLENFSFLPLITCGPKRGYGTHFLFSKGLHESEINDLQIQLIDAVENIATEKQLSTCFSNVTDKELSLKQILIRRGYYGTKGWPVNYITLKWSSFNEYKKFLKNKLNNMDRKVVYEINKNRKSGVEIRILKNIEDNWLRLFELLGFNHKKYNNNPFPLKSNYFIKIKKIFGNNASIYAAFKNNRIIGTCVEVKKDTEAAVTYVGIDHKYSMKDLTYFNITYYEPIKNAIESGIKKIYYGNGLYKAKAKRGFSAEDTYIFYKPNKHGYIIKIWFFFHYLWMNRKFSFVKKLIE